jgi:hypothetical protein
MTIFVRVLDTSRELREVLALSDESPWLSPTIVPSGHDKGESGARRLRRLGRYETVRRIAPSATAGVKAGNTDPARAKAFVA